MAWLEKADVDGFGLSQRHWRLALVAAAAVAGTLLLGAVYVAIIKRHAPESGLALTHRLHLIQNFLCIYIVAAVSRRFKGALDQRLAKVFAAALFVHGLLAFMILAGRWFWSRPVLILSFLVSLAVGALVTILRQRFSAPRVALVGPVSSEAVWDGVVGDRILDPKTSLSGYDIVLVAFDGPVSAQWTRALAGAMLSGCQARHIGEYREELAGAVSIEQFELDHVSNRDHAFYQPLKRAMDVAITLMVLPVALPLGLAGALAILLTMGWPVFFVQERVGLGGKPFRMWKLRTMRRAAPGEDVRAAVRHDLRITPVGRFLRRARIDELPQLWNVLRGDMSLVGPRPEAKDLHAAYVDHTPAYIYRNLVRPGITGWAQVRTTPSVTPDQARRKLRYDLYYVKRGSAFLDLLILARTAGALLRGPEAAERAYRGPILAAETRIAAE